VGGDGYRTYHYELGGRAKRGGMDTALTGFLTDHDLAGDGPGVRAWGLEASAGYAIHDPLYGIAMEASYALNLAEFRRSGTPLDAPWGAYATGDEVPYVPTHSVTGSLVLTTGRSYAGVAANFASRARSEPGTGDFVAAQTVDDRFLLDIVTEFEVFPRVRVFASVYNTTDAVYVASRFPYGAHPGAPRTFTAGLKLDLERRD
jgi:Fe(3+) dicitrate transport protein